jgi:hypothetical protein
MKAVKKQISAVALWLSAALLVACAPAGATTPPATVGLSNPKSLVTVFISPTAEVAQEQASPVALQPSPPPAGALPSPSATPYIGVFLGASTIEPEGLIAPPPQPTPRGVCAAPPAPSFNNTWTANPLLQERLRCAVNSGFGLRLVYQPFERGHMFWRDTGEIYALSEQSIRQGSATDTFWRVTDTWQEGQPESDPALQPPEGLLQPIRGFGNSWRNNPTIRDALGWATAPEQWFDSFWQDFEGGWMMVGPGGQAFALVPTDANTGFHFGALPGS